MLYIRPRHRQGQKFDNVLLTTSLLDISGDCEIVVFLPEPEMNYLCAILLISAVTGQIMFDCDRPGCNQDWNVHCLQSGRIVLGDCKLKQAICLNGDVEDMSFRACRKLVTPYQGTTFN